MSRDECDWFSQILLVNRRDENFDDDFIEEEWQFVEDDEELDDEFDDLDEDESVKTGGIHWFVDDDDDDDDEEDAPEWRDYEEDEEDEEDDPEYFDEDYE